MPRWLIKEEPTHYAFADLVRDGETSWSGIHNALALRHLRSMRPGDEGLYYHTGGEKAIVGRFSVASPPVPDPADDRGSWTVRVRAGAPLERPVHLKMLRGDARFSGFDLVRNSRLSVMPVPAAVWTAILSMASGARSSRAQTDQSGRARPRRKTPAARSRSRGST